jgi:hypothetical protein
MKKKDLKKFQNKRHEAVLLIKNLDKKIKRKEIQY